MTLVESVNIAHPRANPDKGVDRTGIDKRPVQDRVAVFEPEDGKPGLAEDFIGDVKHHGGRDQAVYTFAREDLDRWEHRLGRPLANGSFGENLTTRGIDVTEARVGERWRIGPDVVVQVTTPRIPCATFRGWMGLPGWVKTFTADGRPGAYLRVVNRGSIGAGDRITVVHRPGHDVTIGLMFRALTTERELLPRLLPAGDDLVDEVRAALRQSSLPTSAATRSPERTAPSM